MHRSNTGPPSTFKTPVDPKHRARANYRERQLPAPQDGPLSTGRRLEARTPSGRGYRTPLRGVSQQHAPRCSKRIQFKHLVAIARGDNWAGGGQGGRERRVLNKRGKKARSVCVFVHTQGKTKETPCLSRCLELTCVAHRRQRALPATGIARTWLPSPKGALWNSTPGPDYKCQAHVLRPYCIAVGMKSACKVSERAAYYLSGTPVFAFWRHVISWHPESATTTAWVWKAHAFDKARSRANTQRLQVGTVQPRFVFAILDLSSDDERDRRPSAGRSAVGVMINQTVD